MDRIAPTRQPHTIAVDDAPFPRSHRGDVLVVGVACAGVGMAGVMATRVRRDGRNATEALAKMIAASRFRTHGHAVLLQGIALAGFNVVDLAELNDRIGLPVIVVTRRAPDLAAIRAALLGRVPGGVRKWRLIERAGPMQPLASPRLHVQVAGIEVARAAALLRAVTPAGNNLPEPLRMAHLIAGGIATGESTSRP
jgi:endonuclease V-like protein UPF0215 family